MSREWVYLSLLIDTAIIFLYFLLILLNHVSVFTLITVLTILVLLAHFCVLSEATWLLISSSFLVSLNHCWAETSWLSYIFLILLNKSLGDFSLFFLDLEILSLYQQLHSSIPSLPRHFVDSKVWDIFSPSVVPHHSPIMISLWDPASYPCHF